MLTTHLSRRDWLKVSAAGALGSLAPLSLPSTILGHDQMKVPGIDFTVEDVRLGQYLGSHPRTGQITTQNERRAMIETRLQMGLWRGISIMQRMSAVSPAEVQQSLKPLLTRALLSARQGLMKYDDKTMKAIRGSGTYTAQPAGYPWGKPQFGLRAFRDAVLMNPAWAAKNIEPGMLTLVNLNLDKGSVVSDAAPPKTEKASGDRPVADGNLGLIRRDIKLRPLTDAMKATLDEVQRSHDAWIQAAKDKAPDNELDILVKKHHRQHSELEHLARDHDELTMLALQNHIHDINRTRPKAEIDKLLDASNKAHEEWVKAVKKQDFPRQWLTGLNHARFHVMLGVSSITLPEMT